MRKSLYSFYIMFPFWEAAAIVGNSLFQSKVVLNKIYFKQMYMKQNEKVSIFQKSS